MRKAFTLIEMLIVVALIATLMTIVLKLGAVGSEESARNMTIVRLAKLENCLSGYYAAYGCYPPVPLCNTRSIYEGVNQYGVQNVSQGNGSNRALSDSDLWGWDVKKFQKDIKASGKSLAADEQAAWRQVEAACRSQPVALETPDPDIENLDQAFSEMGEYIQRTGNGGADAEKWSAGVATIYANLGGVDNDSSWRQSQIFTFGLMSFLLPRYQAMMGWKDTMFASGDCVFDQWDLNNGDAPHDPWTGARTTWKNINDEVKKAHGYGNGGGTAANTSSAYLEAIPSEAVTARWLPNLVGACTCDYPDACKFFGVSVGASAGLFTTDSNKRPPLCVYPSGSGQNYHLNRITILDGWDTEFFYYSPSPHQSYQIWSAGKNKRTFPPWVSLQNLDSKAQERVMAWVEDDIRGMRN